MARSDLDKELIRESLFALAQIVIVLVVIMLMGGIGE